MNENYLSIKQFAERAGVSNQAVYQRLDKDLTKYVKVVDGKKKLDISALALFQVKEVGQVEQAVDQVVGQVDQVVGQEAVKALTSTIEVLTDQLRVKDVQISELNERMAELSERLREAQELNRAGHVLLGVEKKKPGLLRRLFGRDED